MNNFWEGTLGAAIKTTWGSMFKMAWKQPAVLCFNLAITLVFQEYILMLGAMCALVILDAILGALAAKDDFDWGVFFKKTLFKMICYAAGLAALMILTYYPFTTGEPNQYFGNGKYFVVLWMIANEYVSIVKNGKKNGVKLGPSFLMKGLKAIDETAKL